MDKWIKKVSKEIRSDAHSSISKEDSLTNLKYLYFKIVDELLTLEENNSMMGKTKEHKQALFRNLSKTLSKIEFHKAAFACAAETILFIYNEQKLVFVQLLQFMDLSVFDFWKLVNSFIVVDPKMPTPLKRHFRDIEIKIVTELGWKNDSNIVAFIKKTYNSPNTEDQANSASSKQNEDVNMQESHPSSIEQKEQTQKKGTTPGSGESPMIEEEHGNEPEEHKVSKPKKPRLEPYSLFFKRVSHLAAYKVLHLCKLLDLEDLIKEQAWELMKQCLSSETYLMFDRHLDQLVL